MKILGRGYRFGVRLLWQASMVGLKRGPHVTRYSMYQRMQDIGPRLPRRTGRVLSISHSENIAELLGLQPDSIVSANYPEHSILSLGFPDSSFDFVLSDQVLEHVEGNPQQAIDESYRVLRPGGIAVHTTCFIHPIHGAPKDFWRFSKDALAYLHRDWSEIIEVGAWGNFDVWKIKRFGLRFEGVPHVSWHPLHRIAINNDPLWPIVTWIVAVK